MLAQSSPQSSAMSWLMFAFLTVGCWGVYGVFLHKGGAGMSGPLPDDPSAKQAALELGRYKAFLFVGIAYFLVAIVGPVILLLMKGGSGAWSFSSYGVWMSLVAGIVGAIGAFGVLLAFGKGGSPSVVMTIIFAGAPVVNALVVIFFVDKTWDKIRWEFVLGIVLAAVGGAMATYFKPPPPKGHAKKPVPQVQPHAAEAAHIESTHKS